MHPGKRAHKSASLRVAIAEGLPVGMWEGSRELISIHSTAQGHGEATALMWAVCGEADSASVVLIVQAQPFAPGLTLEQLRKWYGKFGFVPIQEKPCVLLARQPERVARIANGL
jgi:hypothetical protein